MDSTTPAGASSEQIDGASQTGPDQPSSGSVALTKADLDAFGKGLLDQVGRMVQSDKDGGIAATNKRLGGLEENVQRLLESAARKIQGGASVEDALSQVGVEQEDAEFRTAVRELRDIMKNGGTQFGKGAEAPVAPDAQALQLIGKYKLDIKDVEVAKILASKPADLEGALAKEAFRRLTLPNSTDAQEPTPPDGQSAGAITDEAWAAKADRLARLYDNPSVNAAEIKVLEAEQERYWASKRG